MEAIERLSHDLGTFFKVKFPPIGTAESSWIVFIGQLMEERIDRIRQRAAVLKKSLLADRKRNLKFESKATDNWGKDDDDDDDPALIDDDAAEVNRSRTFDSVP